MNRLTCYLLCIIFSINTFSVNAYVCLEHSQEETSNTTEAIELDENMSSCHEQNDEKISSEKQRIVQNDCCEHNCASCLHLSAFINTRNLSTQNEMALLIESLPNNYSNLIQLIPTPPPNA